MGTINVQNGEALKTDPGLPPPQDSRMKLGVEEIRAFVIDTLTVKREAGVLAGALLEILVMTNLIIDPPPLNPPPPQDRSL